MKNIWRKKITLILQKINIYFEMVHFGPMVPRKRASITANAVKKGECFQQQIPDPVEMNCI